MFFKVFHGNKTIIYGRIADNIRTPICLEQSDRFRYMEILRTTKLPVFPEAGIPGRGLAEVDGKMLEFQTALSVQADDDFGRGRMLEEFSKEKSESKIKKSYIVSYSIFDIHWNSWSSISFNPKKPDACCGQ